MPDFPDTTQPNPNTSTNMAAKTKEELEKELAEALAKCAQLTQENQKLTEQIKQMKVDYDRLAKTFDDQNGTLEAAELRIQTLERQLQDSLGQAKPLSDPPELREKIRAGLTREQAIAVLKAQAEADKEAEG